MADADQIEAPDNIDAALKEYETSVNAPAPEPAEPLEESGFDDGLLAEPEPSPEQVDLQLDEPTAVDAQRAANERDLLRASGEQAQQRAAQLERTLLEIQQREFLRTLSENFDRVAGDIQRDLESQFDDVPTGFAKDHLDLAAVRDPKVLQAWVEQHQNPRAWAIAQRQLISEMHRQLSSRPDREATDDVMAVVAHMRSAGGKVSPELPPQFGTMTNQELNRYTREKHGFSAV